MYATLTDMMAAIPTSELIQLTDDNRTGAIDQDRVNWALGAASAKIDTSVRIRYNLPLPSVPDVLKNFAVAMARYELHARKPAMPEAVRDGYNNAVRWLERLSAGKEALDIAGKEAPAAPAGVMFQTSDRVFSRDSLKGF